LFFLKKIYLNSKSFYFDFFFICKSKTQASFAVCVNDQVKTKLKLLNNLRQYIDNFSINYYDEITLQNGFLEKSKFLRLHLKELVYLLKPGGILNIEYYNSYNDYVGGQLIRPYSFFMNELSLSIGNYVNVTSIDRDNKTTRILIQKNENTPIINCNADDWTFGIISNGSQDSIKNIFRIISEIKTLGIKNFEIVICGPSLLKNIFQEVVIISDDDLKSQLRPPISIKKNRIIDYANFQNLVIQHDRVFYSSDWFTNLKSETNGKFEFLSPIILDDKTKKNRILDWVSFKGNLTEYTSSFGNLISRRKWTEDIYIDGGIFIGKTYLFRENKMNEKLHWGEAEDYHFSRSLTLNGILIKPLFSVKCYTLTHRNKPTLLLKLSKIFKLNDKQN
jgi:hypothetical protein